MGVIREKPVFERVMEGSLVKTKRLIGGM